MNPNEKRVFRIGLVLLAVVSLVAGPLVFAATRPVVPVAQTAEPVVPRVETPPPSPEPAFVVAAPAPVPAKKTPPKARPVVARAHRVVDCSNAPKKEIEVLSMGRVGETVLYCHD